MAVLNFMLFFFLFSTIAYVASAAWQRANATFYDSGASGTGGTCGCQYLSINPYGIQTTALNTTLFNDGQSYGGCYQIACDSTKAPKWCFKGTYITVTATNFFPPNDNGGCCNPPRVHFDMSQAAFQTIANYTAGIIPIFYRKVGWRRRRGIRFSVRGNDYFELVISNVGGSGYISNVWIKGSETNRWEPMTRNWGANWQSSSYLNGQSLSFRVQISNGRTRTALNVVPSRQFGQSFSTTVQF